MTRPILLCAGARTLSHTRVSARVRVCDENLAHSFAHARFPSVCECATCAPPKGAGGVAHATATALPWGVSGSHIVGAVEEARR